MITRQLRTGTRLTALGFGAAQLGNLYVETTDEESHQAVAAALTAGVRYFDTAPHYGLGLSERRLGSALKGVARDEYVISSKVGRLLVDSPGTANSLDTEGFAVPADKRRVWDFSRDGILRSIDDTLTRLGTDHLDIAYLHDPDDFWPQASTAGIETLVDLRSQGVVRNVGVGMNQAPMLADFVERTDVDVVMVAGRFTLIDQSAKDRLLPLALQRGVAIVAAGVYNSGLLSAAQVPDDAHFDYGPAPEEIIHRARRLADICGSYGISLPEAAVQFPFTHPAVASVVLGMRTARHLDGNLKRMTAPIPKALWTELAGERPTTTLIG